jgi:hypothetical protein
MDAGGSGMGAQQVTPPVTLPPPLMAPAPAPRKPRRSKFWLSVSIAGFIVVGCFVLSTA